MDDNGTADYKYKGRFTCAQLKAPGLPVDLAENTSRGKAFYLQEDTGAAMQVLYADEKISSFTTAAGNSSVTVNAVGTASSTGTVIVFDKTANAALSSTVAIGSGGTGSVTVSSGFLSEAESLTATTSSGVTQGNAADSVASGGSLNYGNTNAVGDWVQFAMNVPSPGTYNVKLQVKKHPSRGTAQLYIDGVAQGTPMDVYQSATEYVTVGFGNVTFGTAGNKLVKLQLTGKNPSSAGFGLANDQLIFTRVN